ncbi:MAG: hypothetical protein ACKVXR_07010 [Planctomycetota bacterium]
MRLLPLLLLAILPACTGARAGWASRGRYEVLYESPSVQIRRGSQKLDPATDEMVISWVGARAPEGQAELVACELSIFVDRDEDGAPGAGEILSLRETRETTRKVLYAEVRVRSVPSDRLRARLTASTARERCVATWTVAPD